MPYTEALTKLREWGSKQWDSPNFNTKRSRGLANKYQHDSGFMKKLFDNPSKNTPTEAVGNSMYLDLLKERKALSEAHKASETYSESQPTSSVKIGSNVDRSRLASGIKEAAKELGVDPLDLATIISYETGGTFNPLQKGPTTRFGQHRGLIQFGEPQARQFGVDWNNPYSSQLGKAGAIVKYFRGSGLKKGMGLLDMYSTVNAGRPGLYDAMDLGTSVRQKVEQMRGAHRAKAKLLLG